MKATHKILTAALVLCALSACNEQKFLKEEPYSIYSTDNSLVTQSDYQAMVNHLYFMIKRSCLDIADQGVTAVLRGCNDYGYNSNKYVKGEGKSTDSNNIETWWTPESATLHKGWPYTWDLISNANVVISRIPESSLDESAKNVLLGEALFARSWAYTYLAHIYGGMPLIDEELSAPRRDFRRSTRDSTYLFALEGFKKALSLLPDIDKAKDGQANKQICQHMMAEVNICLKKYDDAITCATNVIEDSRVSLMTDRFGTLKDKPGDVYWDLFRMGNYQYSKGNHEGLLVYQTDFNNSASNYGNYGDRDYLVRDYNCRYIAFKAKFNDGKSYTIFDSKPTSGMCGRAYGYIHPTDHFLTEIWEGLDGDIRNSDYNIQRDVIVNGPELKALGYYGKWFVKDGVLDEIVANGYDVKEMYWWPLITKVANTTYDWPDAEKDASQKNPDAYNGYYVQTGNGRDHSHKDSYMARLAETYLLRAEAYALQGKGDKAAADINVLRDRAHSPHIATADIDVVLDERMRELYAEENRTVTLMRMGKFVERTRKYNDVVFGYKDGRNELLPIPYNVIENNVYCTFEQNPGY